MFTGIISNTAEFSKLTSSLLIKCKKLSAHPGNSISVNGVCLTVKTIKNGIICFDLSEETIKKTSFKHLKTGDILNIESAVKLSDSLGGHIVTGHVDCTGQIAEIRKLRQSREIIITIPSKFKKRVVEKGSIAVDGISLTIAKVIKNGAMISLIPYTLEKTNIGLKKKGDIVNIEFDILYKYAKQKSSTANDNISIDLLVKSGFIA
ncbi:MAG: riboflavin synthase [Planctomycetes bacterium]|nr:riboflavin synthase [Planctomycetota bacterium]